ncbi:hypothetical protein [Sporomusa aerivorans]|uniref:hypothetical protein n=1 Tax=Sporomusa aerivorans TaxID=204936 RepID=UPI00352A084D
MGKVTLIFVGGDTLVDDVIEKVTSGDYSHVAIKINGGVLESTGIMKAGDRYPGVHMRNMNEYEGNPYAVFFDIDLPNQIAAELMAKKLLGKFYSYIGCIEGGAHTLWGINLHPIINGVINWAIMLFMRLPVNLDTGAWTMNCSETVTRILRAGGFNILPGIDADCITPMDLYRYLTGGQLKINEMRNGKMANTNNSIWAALGQIALAAVTSYGASKISDSEASWTTYRNQMVQGMAATALTAAIQQYNTAVAANAQATTTETTSNQQP